MKIDDLKQLKNKISKKELKQLEQIIQHHPFSASSYYLSLINWNDPNDPIRKLAIPSINELDLTGSYDTSGEAENTKLVGLQHKYQETALILSTNKCSVYCRHCFRKRLVGLSNDEIVSNFEASIDYIRKHKEISNVLISGGDSFCLSNNLIERFLTSLTEVSHLNYIRFGTRIPVVNPERVDQELLSILKHFSNEKQIYITTQFNHPREITEASKKCVRKIKNHGITINNQTVLLKGVNDWPGTIIELLEGITSIGVIPYYIFQCRPVKRVKNHFQVPLFEAINIIEEARKQLDGLAKRFKFVMSHKSGKIEILGHNERNFFFKYHQAKNKNNYNKIFKKNMNKAVGWLDDLIN